MKLDPSTIERIREQKAIAFLNRSRRNRVFLVGVAGGIALCLAWLLLFPLQGPSPQWKISICFVGGLVVAAAYVLIRGDKFTPRRAACPVCGYSWEIREGRSVPPRDYMPNWDKCPGCSTPMSEVLLRAQV